MQMFLLLIGIYGAHENNFIAQKIVFENETACLTMGKQIEQDIKKELYYAYPKFIGCYKVNQ